MTKCLSSKKIISLLATSIAILVVLFSVFFISENVLHDCSGENCPICEVMLECSETLKLAGAAIILAVAAYFLIKFIKERCILNVSFENHFTLVSHKVRLNN